MQRNISIKSAICPHCGLPAVGQLNGEGACLHCRIGPRVRPWPARENDDKPPRFPWVTFALLAVPAVLLLLKAFVWG